MSRHLDIWPDVQQLFCDAYRFRQQSRAPLQIFISMKLLNKLLQSTPQKDLKDYQSHIQLHLKEILTTINKHKLEDTNAVNIRKYQCYVNCYNYFNQGSKSDMLGERVQELRSCKQRCVRELRDVEKFLDNINFYSKQKFQGCSQKCRKGTEEENNICVWECLNRLDRRYKQYWANQRTNVEAKHSI